MSKVEELKAAIDELSPRERCELHALLHPLEDDEWDRQMRADAEPGGRLHQMMIDAQAADRAGQLRDWPRLDQEYKKL